MMSHDLGLMQDLPGSAMDGNFERESYIINE